MYNNLDIDQPTGGDHGVVSLLLGALITAHVRTNNLGRSFAKTGFVLTDDPKNVLAPDIAFVSKDRFQLVTDEFLTLAPDLAVEVISFADTAKQINEQVKWFLEAGTRQMWIVHPRTRTIDVHYVTGETMILGIDDTLDGGDILPGFKVPVREIFSVLDD